MVSPTEKCGTVRTRSLCDLLTGRLSTALLVRLFAILSVRPLDKLSVALAGSSSCCSCSSLGSAVLSGVDGPRVSTKLPPMGSCVDTLSIARGGSVASSCLERAM